MSYEYFEADSHASTYNKFRPDPPKNLVERIVNYTRERFSEALDLAVDVGCGSGQSTEVFAPYFKKVFGLDSSEKILNEASKKRRNSNVFYSTCSSEKLNFEDESANLVSACQAVHWFDTSKFYSEAERILKPNGVLALYGYSLPIPVYEDNKEIGNIIEKYYTDVLGQYTLAQSRKVYLENYTSNEFNEIPFVEGGKMQREGNFLLETEGNLHDIIGYITSWSAYQNYTRQMGEENGRKILKSFEDEFRSILKPHGDTDIKVKIKFNYFLLLGRKNLPLH